MSDLRARLALAIQRHPPPLYDGEILWSQELEKIVREIIRQEINKSKTEHGDRIFAKEDADGLRS